MRKYNQRGGGHRSRGGNNQNNHRQQRHHGRGGNQGGGNRPPNHRRQLQQATQARDKHMNQARDQIANGDRVAAENHYQHADHYLRVMNEAQDFLNRHTQERDQFHQEMVELEEHLEGTEETVAKASAEAGEEAAEEPKRPRRKPRVTNEPEAAGDEDEALRLPGM